MIKQEPLDVLLQQIASCRECASHMSVTPRPVLSLSKYSRIIIIGQAPGSIVHKTGKPWDDKSGDNLREWMDVTEDQFYDTKNFGIVPMGFCYPGKGKSGDLPPRKECAPLWHDKIFEQSSNQQLTLLIGQYAQKYYLKALKKKTLTDTVRRFDDYLPEYFVLPHPSPRNNIWMKKNPWFKQEVLPILRLEVKRILG